MKFRKLKKRILTALLISVFLHIGFLVWSYFCKLLPPVPFPEKPESVFHVRIDKEEHLGSPQEKLKFDTATSPKPSKLENPFSENTLTTPSIESEELIKNDIASSVQKQKEALLPSTKEHLDILKKTQLNDILTTRKVRRSLRENLVELGEVPDENFASGSPVLISGEDISHHFLDRSAVPANAAQASAIQSANTETQFQMMRRSLPGLPHESKAADLGTALTYQLFKFKASDGQKYFKLIVKVRDATIDFPVIPKEVIFLLDASGSIGTDRLSQFKEGLLYSLKHLNAHDRFNIIVFKDKTIPLSPVSLEVNPKNIKTAIVFLNELKSWSTTDLYDALRTSLNLNTDFVPSYRVVMSDGFPTTGMIDARHVINEISKINDNRVSIFTFGGGPQVDPYMLDFIAFKNRGWSKVIGRENQMGRGLTQLYNEIKDPLLLNVRYYAGGLNDAEIFPQTMPDFFKGSSFEIFGKYTREDKFAVQILGDMAEQKKQFIVSGSLDQASLGDRSIAHDWAFHKVYYLISQLKYNENNQDLLTQINELCSQFHIITPYSINFRPQLKPAVKPRPAVKSKQVMHKAPAVALKK